MRASSQTIVQGFIRLKQTLTEHNDDTDFNSFTKIQS